jgi:CPA2 family monovalent cation:H+ antiporter-2
MAITLAFSALLGWPAKQAILLAFIVALSSTAVAMRMLDEIGELRTETGRITVGVLIAQDIAIVPMLIFINSFSDVGGEVAPITWWKLVAALLVMAGVVWLLTRRKKAVLPFTEAISGRVELVALACIALCFGAAAITGLLGLSTAFGAFLAGLVIANSTLRSPAIHATEPIQSVLMVVFFLSIGLLIDLNYVLDNLFTVLAFLVGVLVAKSVFNVAILHLVGEPWERAFPAGLIMAQIGEFSFVLATVGFANGMVDADGYRLAIAVIAMSLLVSPLWMVSVRRFDEVARYGIGDFRAALAETYAGEIHELERGADLFRRIAGKSTRQARAMSAAWRQGRSRRRARNEAPKAESSSSPPDDKDAGGRP